MGEFEGMCKMLRWIRSVGGVCGTQDQITWVEGGGCEGAGDARAGQLLVQCIFMILRMAMPRVAGRYGMASTRGRLGVSGGKGCGKAAVYKSAAKVLLKPMIRRIDNKVIT